MIAAIDNGLRIERVPASPTLVPQLVRRAANAINRTIERRVVAGAVRAMESGDAARFAAYMARARAMHMRFDTPSAAQMSAAMAGLEIATEPRTGAAVLQHAAFDEGATLVYVHGGSFIAARSPRLTALIARIAKAARMNTVMVDYRLAPEHPCPAAVDDVVAAVQDLIERGQPAARIGIVAESAGAAIALAAALKLRDAGLALGAFCFLSPWTDLALTGLSTAARSVTGESPINMESMAICAHLYLQGMSAIDPSASPVYGDLRGLGPMLIQTSRTDALHDDACRLANRAHEAGVNATLRAWSRGSHVFERLFDKQSDRAIADAGDFLRRHLSITGMRKISGSL
ncbi:MAG: alpha/beta hydrolase fold domain-containing protein [Alphaproteobacteria bacterium]|nr:alpha/beta hydrolase fold domain-containing protein [Alphaproteobacteria bacterium]